MVFEYKAYYSWLILGATLLGAFLFRLLKKKNPTTETTPQKKVVRKKEIPDKIKKVGLGIGGISFIMLMIAYSNEPRVLSLIVVLGSIFVGGLVLPLAMLLGNKKRIALIIRMLTGKNFGIVRLMNGDVEEKELIKNMDNDEIEINKTSYVLQQGRIYQEGGADLGIALEESKVKMGSGVPIIYIDKDTITLLSFHKDENAMNPKQISGALIANQINREAELLSIRQKQGIKLTIMLVAVVIAAWFAFKSYDAIAGQVIPICKQALANVIPTTPITIPEGANVVTQGA